MQRHTLLSDTRTDSQGGDNSRRKTHRQRSEGIRRAVALLRRELSDGFATPAIFELAVLLEQAFSKRCPEDQGVGRDRHSIPVHTTVTQRMPRPTFEELPIDEAMSDGGWSIMRREAALMTAYWSDALPDDTPPPAVNQLLGKTA